MEPLFDVIITAYGDTNTGGSDNSVRVVGRYRDRDGEQLGELESCTLAEAMEYASGAVVAFMEGTQA